MPIDMHSHYYGGLVDHLRKRTARPCISVDANGRNVLNAMTASTVMSAGYTSMPERTGYLAAAGISRQLMTFPGSLGIDVMPMPEVGPVIAGFNDHLSELCRASGGRFLGLAGLPLADVGEAAHELRRARRELGLLGAILPGNFFLTIERAEQLRPVLAVADDVGALLMIHPGLAPGESPPEPLPEPSVYRTSGLALQASISQMGITLLFSDLLESYRNVAFHLVNLGGTLPFILERLDALADSRDPQRPFPHDRLRSLYYDCASLGPRALQLAVKVLGADRIMLGTDYPIFQPHSVVTAVAQAAIADSERALVLEETAHSVIARFL